MNFIFDQMRIFHDSVINQMIHIFIVVMKYMDHIVQTGEKYQKAEKKIYI